MALPATIYRRPSDGKFIKQDGKIVTGVEDCCCDKHCYSQWVWNCSTEAVDYVTATCESTEPEGVGVWTWNGTNYVYIQEEEGACEGDEDCDGEYTPPDPPGDTSNCRRYHLFRRCDDDTLLDMGMTVADAFGLGGQGIEFSEECYYVAGDYVYDAPAVVVDLEDVTLHDNCAVCAGEAMPCPDLHCIHVEFYDDTDTLIGEMFLDDDCNPGLCGWAEDAGCSPQLFSNTIEFIILGPDGGWYGDGLDGSNVRFGVWNTNISGLTLPTAGYYAVVTAC